MGLHNLMEDVVRRLLLDLAQKDERLKESGEKLHSDIMAIALNNLPPKYVSTAKGEMFAKTQISKQLESDAYLEITRAIEKVFSTKRDPGFRDD